jgi:hypothetical protein
MHGLSCRAAVAGKTAGQYCSKRRVVIPPRHSRGGCSPMNTHSSRGLALPGVVQVQELLHADGGCCLMYEDSSGTPLQALSPLCRPDLTTFFTLAMQLAGILAELHRREIIHQHLTPGAFCCTRRPMPCALPTSAWRHGRSARCTRRYPLLSGTVRWRISLQNRLAA